MTQLRGSLESMALSDVLQILNINRRTGNLQVFREKDRGVIFVQKGKVVHAELGPLSGERAAFKLIHWDCGFFEFVSAAHTAPATIHRPLTDLLMESARITDTRKQFDLMFPNLRATPWTSLPGPALIEGLRFFPENLRVLPFLNGYHSFMDIIRTSEESDVTIFQTCIILANAGRLHLFEPEREFAVTRLKASLFFKPGHIALSAQHEQAWSSMEPYAQQPIVRVKLVHPNGHNVVAVQFKALDEHKTVAVPKVLMQACGISEGSIIKICPAP